MQWLAPSDKAQNAIVVPFAVAVAIISLPVLLPTVLLIAVCDKMGRLLRPSRDWHSWLAWRPVPVTDYWDGRRTWAWLQRVERRSRPYGWPNEYRLPGKEAA